MYGYYGSSDGVIDKAGTGTWRPEDPGSFHLYDPATPWYPQEYANDPFQDNPQNLLFPVEFEVCRVCVDKAGCACSVGPCKKWKFLDSGDLDFATSLDGPSSEWWSAVNKSFPNLLCTGR